jgi:3-phenylpropionate/cinnamic acid dioxygenase small subunit
MSTTSDIGDLLVGLAGGSPFGAAEQCNDAIFWPPARIGAGAHRARPGSGGAVGEGTRMIQPADAHQLVSAWWFAYDNALFDEWPAMWSADARFTCRTDTGRTAFEDLVTAEVGGREAVLAWQTDHRLHSPHPLRHNGENVHLTRADETTADFRSYIWVTQIVDGSPSALSTAVVHGALAVEDGTLRISEMHVVLDTEDSTVLAEKQAARPG